ATWARSSRPPAATTRPRPRTRKRSGATTRRETSSRPSGPARSPPASRAPRADPSDPPERPGLSGSGEGQPDVERRAAGAGVDRQRAVVAVDDDAPGRREAEAGALPDVLRGEERVEDALADLVRDPGAVVAHVDD